MLSTAHFGHTAPSVHSIYPITSQQPTRSRSEALLPQPRVKCNSDLDTSVHKLLKQYRKLGQKIEKETAGLTGQLIAARHLFQNNASESAGPARTLNLHAPVKNLMLSERGVRHFLHDISPLLAEDAKVTQGIRDIANHAVVKSFKGHLKNSPLKDLDPSKFPEKWLPEEIIYLLRIGNWKEINLNGIKLENANMSGLDLRYAKIRDAKLHHVNFNDCLMEGIDMTGSDISCSTFIRAVINMGTLESVDADRSDFTRAKLKGIQAGKASFMKARFSGADPEQANFTEADLINSSGLTLRHTNMTGAAMWHAATNFKMIDEDFQDLDASTRKQLETIKSMPPGCERLCNEMLNMLIEGTGAKLGRLKDTGPLANTLLTRESAWKDINLRNFIDTDILRPLLLHWNASKEDRFDLSPQNVLSYIAYAKPKLDWPAYCAAISHMLVDAEANQRMDQRDALCALLKTDPTIASLNRTMEEHGLAPFEDYSFFIAPSREEAVVYPNSLIFKMLNRDGSPFHGSHFTRNIEGKFTRQPLQSIDAIERCGVPTKLFYIDPAPVAALRLIEHIFPDNRYQKAFTQALTSISLSMRPELMNPRTGQRDHYGLAEDLGKFLRGVGRTSFVDFKEVEHLRQTVVDSGIQLKDDDNGRTAMLLCLSALILGAATPDLLGSKPALKKSLQEFSAACIRSASLLDENLLPDTEREISRSVEEDGTFSRIIQSANLAKYTDQENLGSSLMEILNLIGMKAASNPELEKCFKGIYPQAWIPEPALEKITVVFKL